MDFGFSRYDLNKITKRIELPEITPDGCPTIALIVRCANNKAFAAVRFKQLQSEAPAGQPQITDGQAAPTEAPSAGPADFSRIVAELYSGPVIVGWENMVDGSGDAVPYSEEACLAFLEQLIAAWPNLFLNRIKDFVELETNFRPARKTVDPVDLGKEPPRG